ncbi:antitoxin Xre/MbcA/ParS toxin-binding domain-containing protein [Magnetospirillum moscoviense]|uniref:Antitoxin Xre/MbcA/ParS-like toxin-binding domain-containing protein n=1 Tax=Magnetospirillum moscoviense TaxID=1437059 RepID=A0A178MZL4_9PROT|nr:antitoxin Xre/MbcA/ParS toxin-binding domain-containing protein [Magnetospirillum moscoviense]MBF0327459.1 DUF2384 domain-containing protein [Alphaproteobacteria bacterium]OAN65095.1 hypothetical protein A6A05_18830 [Magnetospirillum moscoviense]
MFKTQEDMTRGIAAAFAILDRWRLSQAEINGVLGFPFGTQIAEWRRGELSSMPSDVVRRFGYVVAIYRVIQKLPTGIDWLRQPIPDLDNQSPLVRMASGDVEDLRIVRDRFERILKRQQA